MAQGVPRHAESSSCSSREEYVISLWCHCVEKSPSWLRQSLSEATSQHDPQAGACPAVQIPLFLSKPSTIFANCRSTLVTGTTFSNGETNKQASKPKDWGQQEIHGLPKESGLEAA